MNSHGHNFCTQSTVPITTFAYIQKPLLPLHTINSHCYNFRKQSTITITISAHNQHSTVTVTTACEFEINNHCYNFSFYTQSTVLLQHLHKINSHALIQYLHTINSHCYNFWIQLTVIFTMYLYNHQWL